MSGVKAQSCAWKGGCSHLGTRRRQRGISEKEDTNPCGELRGELVWKAEEFTAH